MRDGTVRAAWAPVIGGSQPISTRRAINTPTAPLPIRPPATRRPLKSRMVRYLRHAAADVQRVG